MAASVALAAANPLARPLIAQPVIVVGIVIAWARVRNLEEPHRRAWTLFTAGGTLIFAGAVGRVVHGTIIGVEQPLPSPGDILLVAGYGAFILGALEFLRRRSGAIRDWDSWLDALIVTAAIGVVVWVLLLEPYANDPSVMTAERVTNIGYTILSLILLTVCVRVVQAPGRRPLPYYLFGGAVGVFFASDLLSTVNYALNFAGDLPLILTPLIYGLFLATIYHPQMKLLTATPVDREPPLGIGRFGLLAVAQAIPPVILTLQVTDSVDTSRPVLLAATFIITGLVLARLAMLVRGRDAMLQRGEDLRFAGERLSMATSIKDIGFIGVESTRSVCTGGLVFGSTLVEQTHDGLVTCARWGSTTVLDSDDVA